MRAIYKFLYNFFIFLFFIFINFVLKNNFLKQITWPLTFFDFEHLQKTIPLSGVHIFHIIFPKFCFDCGKTFDSKFPIPEVFLSKGHQKLNCRRVQPSLTFNQGLFHHIVWVHLNTQIGTWVYSCKLDDNQKNNFFFLYVGA